MKGPEVKQRFMLCRAQGKSFETISRELNVRKQTLITWEREYREEIANLRAIELEALRERFWLSTKAQTELFGEQLSRVAEELGKRDFSDVSTPKLMDMLIKLNAKLEAVCPAPVLRDETQIAEHKALRTTLSSVAAQYGKPEDRNGDDDVTAGAEFLVSVLLTLLRRYEDGEIDERTVRTEIELIAPLLKGIELTSIERQNERILGLLQASGARGIRLERGSHA